MNGDVFWGVVSSEEATVFGGANLSLLFNAFEQGLSSLPFTFNFLLFSIYLIVRIA